MKISTKFAITIGSAIGLIMATPAFSEDYPSEQITIIVPSKAGGSTDLTARIFAEVAEKSHEGYNFVIKNVSGSGGQKGFEEIARADKDGYTIGLNFTPQLVAHIASGRAKYKLDSFHVMGNISQDPAILVVPKDSAITNLEEFTAAAKAGQLTVAVNGIGSDDYLAAKAYETAQEVTFNLLPTDGSTEQKAGVLGGHFDASFMNLSQMLAQHNAGDARIIAILTDERDSALDVGTAKEQGVDVTMSATRGFIAPAGIDTQIQGKLDEVFADVTGSEEFTNKAAEGNIQLLIMNGPDYLEYLTSLEATTQAVFDKEPW